MSPRIRPALLAALALSTLGVLAGAARAQAPASSPTPASPAWPAKPIKYVVPFSPGGVSDGVARLVAQHLAERLGQPVIIDNRPGVSGIVGTQAVARAPADGYTLMGGTITTHAVNPFFNKNLGYDPVKDFAAVNLVGMVSNVLVVPEGSRFNSVAQLIAELKAKPDSLTYGTAGPGTSQHLSGQLFESITQTRMRQIAYKGGSQAIVDLVGGQIDMVFETVAAARPMIDGKRVKVLGVTAAKRLASLPGVATLAEAGAPNFEMQSWQGVFAPAGTPKVVVDRLAREIASIVAMPDVQEKLRGLGVEPDGRTAQAFSAFQRAEIAKWGKVIKDAGIQAE
ncbi:tripartite-type tricarboxylate transporter receptor subunit TctC [Variovorax boronicumulans]|uniref:Bug family tripartite tricarboxylate transporter substrate binding protein n=1 Tax=Variovorax boronicumulans TaxID=436515 RepID=UPI002782F6CF|nr:tripartite tricarboxylate transporter substrate binding protein [Variovorax boronicumulans]MDQ0072539.1 tripartite-type tricarboxylate transporter receptor subunit TctC [Variovorax boronicumulans]